MSGTMPSFKKQVHLHLHILNKRTSIEKSVCSRSCQNLFEVRQSIPKAQERLPTLCSRNTEPEIYGADGGVRFVSLELRVPLGTRYDYI